MEEILIEIRDALRGPKQEKATLTVLECSQFMDVNKDKIRELIAKPDTDFPFFKNGNKVLINKALLTQWLDKVSKEHREI
ncbi:excisionase [Clostridium butyricum]|jgi:excisionase family DNA binding protein|uniref:excisionase n=1 Tax=Clostridium butyricum TaxID=1492 RepID=UPI00071E9DE1|nr:excisionase [Clostridium butyricum]ALS17779.1 excisionase [Clostridium butyricum]MDB2161818.1 excisionase [Clostridium butyricum]